MKLNVKNTIGITAFLISQVMSAQFYVGVQSGAGSILSNIKATSASYELGGAIKVGYIYSLSNHIGIGTGIEFSQYKQDVFLSNSSATLSNYEVDPSTSAFEYRITASNYKERQTLHAIQIPLFVQYKMNINKGIDFNFRAGAKYFLPVNYKIKATATNVNGTGYYPDVNLTIDDLPEYGFGSQSNYSASGEYETKGIVMSMFELGFTFDMGAKNALYVAMFLENGYGSIVDQNKDESYIGYNPTSVADRKANGLYSTDENAKIRPVAFGVTLAWNFK
ncbi:outer membrane beta-barrel protein [Flavobacterium sp. KBS0721]|uniref:outer membrane beta-barrel protein n=1 Tax=Flavobacterium sp. KBS0721 TaxID=1179672 RepID=UPI00143DB88B|nr:outer membrane beta-barrel protein [Flavobacterium sp. KBS0721]